MVHTSWWAYLFELEMELEDALDAIRDGINTELDRSTLTLSKLLLNPRSRFAL